MFKKSFLVTAITLIILVLSITGEIMAVSTDKIKPEDKRLIYPEDLIYMGAFRLPECNEEFGWEYGGAAMTFYPGGDISGPSDSFPGSIFATGHPYNMYVSEIDIPVPVISKSKNLNDLNRAKTLQPFSDVREGLFSESDGFDQCFLRVAMEYLPKQGKQKSEKLYFAWGQHCQEEERGPSHTWCDLNLSCPNIAGPWIIGGRKNYVTNDYIFEIPGEWADIYTPGMYLATGRYRDGGQGAQGPSLFAYGPWNEGNPPPPGSELKNKALLLYEDVYGTHTMENYHHSDEWTGGAWLTSGDKCAVIFAGTKGTGDCWYGFSDGTVWPEEPPFPPVPPDGDRGWWSTAFEGEIIFYSPFDLASVAKGEKEPYEPQPYAVINIDKYLFNVNSTQQLYHLGAVSFDRDKGYLYIFEFLADEDKPVVHVWKINEECR